MKTTIIRQCEGGIEVWDSRPEAEASRESERILFERKYKAERLRPSKRKK